MRRVFALPELLGVVAVAAFLNLWNLSVNGDANTFYAAAVKSMAGSWHDLLYNSLDKGGLMTVDKPPLADWIEALSVRIFGWSSWSLLAPQALMGIIAAVLMYDLVRRRSGRVAGVVAGLVLATTPTIVAVSRHNNPDELLVCLCVAAVWFALRALETGRSKWLIWCGVMVGLGFETKMGVALMLVPGIAAAWIWTQWDSTAGRSANLKMLWQLLRGGLVMAVVGLAWPVFVSLTPAADRPYISSTSDNSIWSLMFGYNGIGRIAGQAGGPSAGGIGTGTSTLFGGPTGVFRLIGDALGDQVGWLLGFAVVAAVALIALSRLRRSDPRTGFVLIVGVTLLIVGGVFSFASGIFHPYYVSMVAPWIAALIGAGVGEMLPAPYGVARLTGRSWIFAPLMVIGGGVTELIVLNEIGGQLAWARWLVLTALIGGGLLLMTRLAPPVRLAAIAAVLALLLAAPATWAAETLGYATSSTFPMGGPASTSVMGGGASGPGGSGGFGSGHSFGGASSGGSFGGGRGSTSASNAARPPDTGTGVTSRLFGSAGSGTVSKGSGTKGFGGARAGGFSRGGGGGSGFGGGAGASGNDGSTELDAASAWVAKHGGGTVAVESQSTAAAAILAGHENVAGIGGFSGVESSVSANWIAMEVKAGKLTYLLSDSSQFSSPSDGRSGSAAAIRTAESVARKIRVTDNGETFTLYDLQGKAAAILAATSR